MNNEKPCTPMLVRITSHSRGKKAQGTRHYTPYLTRGKKACFCISLFLNPASLDRVRNNSIQSMPWEKSQTERNNGPEVVRIMFFRMISGQRRTEAHSNKGVSLSFKATPPNFKNDSSLSFSLKDLQKGTPILVATLIFPTISGKSD